MDTKEGVQRLQALLAEFVGTFFLTFAAVLSGWRSEETGNAYLGVALTLVGLIYSFDHVSGAHFNPAVTVGVVICNFSLASVIQGVIYIIFQVLGAICGGLAGLSINADIVPFQPLDVAHPSVSVTVVEGLFAFALVLVMLNVAAEKNAAEPNAYFGISVAFVVLAGGSAVGRISGGVFNPAVGTALNITEVFGGHESRYTWAYWIGPIIGAILAGFVKLYINSEIHQRQFGDAPSIYGLPIVVLIVEFIGTFFLTLTAGFSNTAPLAVGAILLSMVYMGDHLCGVDYNPAVTLGAALRWGIPAYEYWKVALTALSQFLGAVGAAFIVYGVSGKITFPNESNYSGIGGELAFEILWSTLLVYCVCAVMTPISSEPHDTRQLSRRGFTIGFIVAGGVYCAGKIGSGSGGVFNPALGTAITIVDAAFQGSEAHKIWIYWVGPLLGALFGSGLFSLLHAHADPPAPGELTEEDTLYDGDRSTLHEQSYDDNYIPTSSYLTDSMILHSHG